MCNTKYHIVFICLLCSGLLLPIIQYCFQAKPNEEIVFDFTISNESKKKVININFIHLLENSLNFNMNNHEVRIGYAPVPMQPSKF